MSIAGQKSVATQAIAQASPFGRHLLQRKCACGAGKSPLAQTCEDCEKKGLQRKLAVGASNDPLELEADRIADQVLQRNTPAAIANSPVSIRRATPAASGAMSAPPSVQRAIADGGRPLEPALRQDMEGRFGHDFSRVRIHTGSAAAISAQDVDAHAYTLGQSIVFDAGRFSTDTSEGRRLLAHELTHVVQQTGAKWIQREVNPKRIASKEDVLAKVKTRIDEVGPAEDPATGNLLRLGKLGAAFNPGATKEEKDNAFVYTCRCGWIDMGHFFISAAAAYGLGYQRKRLDVRVGGKSRTIEQLLTGGQNRLSVLLDALVKSVPDSQGNTVIADVRRLLQSGEPRDIALVFGYWMEFVQQVAKLVDDPGSAVPAPLKRELKSTLDEYRQHFKTIVPEGLQGTIEGSARSAFTVEDLPSDCYGAALGQDVWKRTDGAKRDLPPIHGLLQQLFSDCGAVHPAPGSKTRCEMMAETTPGSCHMEGDKDVWPPDLGEPARHGSTKPKLLTSAKPLCGESASVLPCPSATGEASAPLPAATVDLSGEGLTGRYDQGVTLYQPREKAGFGNGPVAFPGRPEDIQREDQISLLPGTTLRITPKLNVIGRAKFGGVPGLGDYSASLHLDPSIGNFGAGKSLGLRNSFDVRGEGNLQLHMQGNMDIDLSDLLEGLAGPEIDLLKAVFKSDDFTTLLKQLAGRDITIKTFMKETKRLVKQSFPGGIGPVVRSVLAKLEAGEALALATRIDARGSVSIGGIPIAGVYIQKSFGLRPLLVFEYGAILSELLKNKTIVGGKVFMYGQDLAQVQAIAGFDPIGKKGVAQLHGFTKSVWRGNKLGLDLTYQVNLSGDQEFKALVFVGGTFERGGSKEKGEK
ncbi:MAG: peptidase superfamily protein [Burkholderiaceae bacterium]|nr:peptidase superfamily protein [Burkholderiaceae bacterium]